MQKFWQIMAGIGMFFAAVFYFLFNTEKNSLIKNKINFAEKEAESSAKERHEKVEGDSVATATDISKML